MHENPCSAPQTSDNELRDTPRRPASVKLAAAFIICSLLAGHSKFLFVDTPTTGVMTGVAFSLVFGLTALLIAAILSRINWARWIVAILLAANISLFPFAIEHALLPALRIILAAQATFQLGALVLMFLPPSARWYRPDNSSKPNGLRPSA